MDDVLKLPQTMDVARARALFEEFPGRRGRPLWIDAGDVEKMGALAVEVLISAARQWRADGQSFRIRNASDVFRDVLSGLAIDPATMQPAGPVAARPEAGS